MFASRVPANSVFCSWSSFFSCSGDNRCPFLHSNSLIISVRSFLKFPVQLVQLGQMRPSERPRTVRLLPSFVATYLVFYHRHLARSILSERGRFLGVRWHL